MSAQPNTRTTLRHAGPHLGMLAIVYTLLFNAGLCAVSAFGIPFGVKQPYWPGPGTSERYRFILSGTLHGRANLRVLANRRIESTRHLRRNYCESPPILRYQRCRAEHRAFRRIHDGI